MWSHTVLHTSIYIQLINKFIHSFIHSFIYGSQYSNSLHTVWFGDRIPVGVRTSTPVQTSPGAHPASYTMGTGSFPGVKRPRCGINHWPLSSDEVKKRVELYLYSTSTAFVAGYGVKFTFTNDKDSLQ